MVAESYGEGPTFWSTLKFIRPAKGFYQLKWDLLQPWISGIFAPLALTRSQFLADPAQPAEFMFIRIPFETIKRMHWIIEFIERSTNRRLHE